MAFNIEFIPIFFYLADVHSKVKVTAQLKQFRLMLKKDSQYEKHAGRIQHKPRRYSFQTYSSQQADRPAVLEYTVCVCVPIDNYPTH